MLSDLVPTAKPPGATVALYYPHIHFRSRAWLRTAALYYDSISRIVPPGLNPDELQYYEEFARDAPALLDDIRELKASGFIRDEPPGASVSSVANEFFDFAMENLIEPSRRAALVPRLARRQSFYTIHPAKIDPGLLNVLEELNLAHQKQGDPYSDWNLEPVTGGLYMLFLATKMAGDRQLVSDNSVYQSLLYKPVGDFPAENTKQDDSRFRLATAVFRAVIPRNLKAVSIDTLLRIRTDFADERRRFQDGVAALANDLESPGTEEHLLSALERQSQTIDDEYQAMLDKARVAGLSFGQGLFSVSVPSFITAHWGLAAAAPPFIFGGLAVAMSAVAMKYVYERRITHNTSPWTYLLRVDNALSAEELASDIVTLNLDVPDYDDPRRILAY